MREISRIRSHAGAGVCARAYNRTKENPTSERAEALILFHEPLHCALPPQATSCKTAPRSQVGQTETDKEMDGCPGSFN
jgi:hypothetical protein